MYFRNEYKFLSNFQYAEVIYNGIIFPTVENAFQAAKTLDKTEQLRFKTIAPNEAKKLGRKVSLRPDWETVKTQIMKHLLQQKFPLDPEDKNYWLSEKLANTGDGMIVEENTWHDNAWGACTCARCQNKIHKNLLGQLLMERRTEIKVTQKRGYQSHKYNTQTVAQSYATETTTDD